MDILYLISGKKGLWPLCMQSKCIHCPVLNALANFCFFILKNCMEKHTQRHTHKHTCQHTQTDTHSREWVS